MFCNGLTKGSLCQSAYLPSILLSPAKQSKASKPAVVRTIFGDIIQLIFSKI
jgi:hypothetical protein